MLSRLNQTYIFKYFYHFFCVLQYELTFFYWNQDDWRPMYTVIKSSGKFDLILNPKKGNWILKY